MNIGLEVLENIKFDMEYVTRLDFVEPKVRGEVQQELYKIYHRETPEFDIIEKSLKALELLKIKEVNVFIFLHSGDLETYNDMVEDNRKLTIQEYDLLKEVFNYE